MPTGSLGAFGELQALRHRLQGLRVYGRANLGQAAGSQASDPSLSCNFFTRASSCEGCAPENTENHPCLPPPFLVPPGQVAENTQRAHTRNVGGHTELVVPSLFGRPVLGLPAGGDIAALEPEVCFLGYARCGHAPFLGCCLVQTRRTTRRLALPSGASPSSPTKENHEGFMYTATAMI